MLPLTGVVGWGRMGLVPLIKGERVEMVGRVIILGMLVGQAQLMLAAEEAEEAMCPPVIPVGTVAPMAEVAVVVVFIVLQLIMAEREAMAEERLSCTPAILILAER